MDNLMTQDGVPTKTMQCRHGMMKFMPHDVYIGRALELYGEYSEEEVAFLTGLLTPDDTVVEVGANIGAITLPLARAAKWVYAFEPQAPLHEILRDTLDANSVDNVTTKRCAIGREFGTACIPPLEYAAENNFGGISLGDTGTPVAVETLDSYGFEQVRLLKIDVEGMEADVLAGAQETIQRCRPLIYVENDRSEKAAALIRELRALGYRLYWHKPRLFSVKNYRHVASNVFGNVVSMNMLCVPNEEALSFDLEPVIEPDTKRKTGWACVVRLGGVGDNLIASSVFRQLKERYGKLEVITQNPQAAVFENNPYIDKLAVHDKGDLPIDQTEWQKWFVTRSKEYDFLVNLSHSCESLLATFPSQTAFWWPAEFRRKLCGRNYVETVHDICGLPYECDPRFYPTDAERAKAAETKARMGERVIGWCLSGSRIDKVYPYSAMAIARLIRELGVQVMMFGAPGPDFEMAKAIMEHVERQNGTHDGLHLALSPDPKEPSWPIRRILAQAHACDLVIGPDTGPMWGVAREAMPKIVLISHASPENITKHWVNTVTLHADPKRVPCWPCHRLHTDLTTCTPNADNNAAACIADISVEKVVATVNALLKRS